MQLNEDALPIKVGRNKLMESVVRRYKIALIPGDGIGKEVVPAAVSVLERAGQLFSFTLDWDEKPWGCEYFERHGEMLPADGLASIARHDAIYLGAVGFPTVPDHISLWGLLIPIRRRFDQYVNLRPIRLLPGVSSPLRSQEKPIDFLIVRENTEGEYSDQGAVVMADSDDELVIQHSFFSRRGVDRIARYAFELAQRRKQELVWATKSNGVFVAMPYWDGRVRHVAEAYPNVQATPYHVDILAAHFVKNPSWFDVVLASNLMGDILSDLGAACVGTIGIAPSANLNPERKFPSMFEPVHGSAPDIYGRGIANPIGQIWSGAMMLEHLGEEEAAAAVMRAMETILREGPRTPDLGGSALTDEVGQAVMQALEQR